MLTQCSSSFCKLGAEEIGMATAVASETLFAVARLLPFPSACQITRLSRQQSVTECLLLRLHELYFQAKEHRIGDPTIVRTKEVSHFGDSL